MRVAASVFVLSLYGSAGLAAAQPAVDPRMEQWSSALGVACTHCHVDGQWADESKPTFDFARRMMRMVDGLNGGPLKGIGTVTCRTCHRGQRIPARLSRDTWQRILSEHEAEFARQPERGLAMSVYSASLGVDCSYCHDADRAAAGTPAKAMVARMLPIFDEIPRYFSDARKPTTQCYMCHQGRTKPE